MIFFKELLLKPPLPPAHKINKYTEFILIFFKTFSKFKNNIFGIIKYCLITYQLNCFFNNVLNAREPYMVFFVT